jgi:phenylacetate-CoA ligase
MCSIPVHRPYMIHYEGPYQRIQGILENQKFIKWGHYMLRKELFILAHQLGDISFHSTYKGLIQNQWKTYDELKNEQEKQLRKIINFSYENVPYYHHLFNNLSILPKDIRKIEDLEKLPLLTKDIINDNWESFKPANIKNINYYTRSTGGSTGAPLNYRISKNDRFLSAALLYRGWGYAGYKLGDKMIFLAGSSLDVGTKSCIETKFHEIIRNVRKLSSFDMGNEEMRYYSKLVNNFKPKYIRGYASSINFFAQWIEENDIQINSPDGVFTTSDKLFPKMRETISRVFKCDVFDGYGLNDGGASAYECTEHSGLHIDTERSIMEVIDSDDQGIDAGQGEAVLTSLYNYSMPFIRYTSGDNVRITEDVCGCGRGSKLLEDVVGRSVDVLVTPEGKNIHGWFFLYIFWEYSVGIKEYQVVQKNPREIHIKLVTDDHFNADQLETIKKIALSKCPDWNIKFYFVDRIERTDAGKYKFIINEVGGSY